jgi:demethylmacrocin O-methyltransferase
MWKRYFPFGRISSIDIYDKTFFQERRIKIFQGSQTDPVFLKNVINQIGSPDIIIDDGSHINSHVIETFMFLFPLLKEGGIYVIEDTETSYWPDYGGDSENLNNPNTSMNYFKKLVDGLNHKEFLLQNYEPSYYDLNIISIQFYHNLIFIFKGINNEPSGIDPNNEKSTLVDEMFF